MSHPVLYIVSTPIGTLADFSPHAIEILSTVDFIACEDTRHTQKLLSHFKIQNQLVSLHAHNEKEKSHYLIEKLKNSKHKCAAVVSDAGTPCISDPGSFLVRAAHECGVKILTAPGPSSMTSALAACGFIQPRILFSGFLDRSKTEQKKEFSKWKAISPCIAVFFESPKRIKTTLQHVTEYFAECPIEICISREISKKFEEHINGNPEKIISYLNNSGTFQGEFVICINIPELNSAPKLDDEDLIKEIQNFIKNGNSPKTACKAVSLKYDKNPKQLYNLLQKMTK